jgi:hypothetical protein
MPLIKQLTEVAIRAELDHHLSSTEEPDKVVGTLIFITPACCRDGQTE